MPEPNKKILLMAETFAATMSGEQLDQFGHSIFPCGRCSTDGVAVYHNVFGRHMHIQSPEVADAVRKCEESGKETSTEKLLDCGPRLGPR
jgi:hypothetical protein